MKDFKVGSVVGERIQGYGDGDGDGGVKQPLEYLKCCRSPQSFGNTSTHQRWAPGHGGM